MSFLTDINHLSLFEGLFWVLSERSERKSTMCEHIFTKGPRKGQKCSVNPRGGKGYCAKHRRYFSVNEPAFWAVWRNNWLRHQIYSYIRGNNAVKAAKIRYLDAFHYNPMDITVDVWIWAIINKHWDLYRWLKRLPSETIEMARALKKYLKNPTIIYSDHPDYKGCLKWAARKGHLDIIKFYLSYRHIPKVQQIMETYPKPSNKKIYIDDNPMIDAITAKQSEIVYYLFENRDRHYWYTPHIYLLQEIHVSKEEYDY